MPTERIGRVQGAGVFLSTSTSDTLIPKVSVIKRDVEPMVGDTILNANSDLCAIEAIGESDYTVTKQGSTAGPQGNAATVSVGTVTTVSADASAKVTNRGTANDAVFDFELPQGQPGGLQREEDGYQRLGYKYYNVGHWMTTETPKEIIIKTGIKWVSSAHMPIVHLYGFCHGHDYGKQHIIDLKFGFYIYENHIGYCTASNAGAWRPEIRLLKYIKNEIEYVAIGLICPTDSYYPQFGADVHAEHGLSNIEPTGWTCEFHETTGNIPAGEDNTSLTCVNVPYKTALTAEDVGAYSPSNPPTLLKGLDTREENMAPSYYITFKNQYSTLTEFKQVSTMGLSSLMTGEFCLVYTMIPWFDASGGYPIQKAVSAENGGIVAVRSGLDENTWSAWSRVYTTNDPPQWSEIPGTIPADKLSTKTDYYRINPTPAPNGYLHAALEYPTLGEMALISTVAKNRLQFYDPSLFTFEISDDGVTWTPHEVSVSNVKRLVAGNGEHSTYPLIIPNGKQLRMTIENDGTYVFLNYLHFLATTRYNSLALKLETKNKTTGEWSTVYTSENSITGYPVHVWAQHTRIPWSQTASESQCCTVRVTFSATWNNSNVIDIDDLQWYGTYPARPRELYAWDEDKNVSFPGRVAVSTPTADNDAATKAYVDGKTAEQKNDMYVHRILLRTNQYASNTVNMNFSIISNKADEFDMGYIIQMFNGKSIPGISGVVDIENAGKYFLILNNVIYSTNNFEIEYFSDGRTGTRPISIDDFILSDSVTKTSV